jgi:uncharacterized protein YkwD
MIKYKALIIFSIFAVILGGCSKDSDEKAGTSATEITVTESADNESVDSEDESAGQRRVVASDEKNADEVDENTEAEMTEAAMLQEEVESDDEEISEEAVLTAAALLTKAAEENGIVLTEAASNSDSDKNVNSSTPSPASQAAISSKSMYATKDLNVRAGSSTSSELIGEISTGDEVKVLEILDNNWAKISFNDSYAYVYSSYLSDKVVVASTNPTSTPKPTSKPTATVTPKLTSTPTATMTPTPKANSKNTSSGSTNEAVSISKVSIIANSHDIHTYSSEIDNNGLSYYSENEDVINDHFNAVNNLRTSVGLSKFTLDPTLCRVAAYRTAELIKYNYFGHYHPGYDESVDSACAFDVIYFFQDGYRYIAENIANQSGDWKYFYERSNLGQVFCDQFADSANHYANMTNSNYTKIGICVYIDKNYVLVTQIFG